MPNPSQSPFFHVFNARGLRGVLVGSLWIALALPATTSAQEAIPPATAPDLPASRADAQPGQPYSVGEFGAWSVRCLRRDDQSAEPCEMSQTLFSEDGSPTAEISVFAVNQGPVVSGATLVTPLETLLTRNITFRIESSEAKQYPFTFCNRQGCVAQVGFTAEELAAMKAGITASMEIYPVAAPDTAVRLTVSLEGFTAAHAALTGGIQ